MLYQSDIEAIADSLENAAEPNIEQIKDRVIEKYLSDHCAIRSEIAYQEAIEASEWGIKEAKKLIKN